MIKQAAAPAISFVVEKEFVRSLKKLPWRYPIEEWRRLGVKHLNIKCGMGRHPVVFAQTDGRSFAVKKLGLEGAKREVENYREMLERGIHTLVPVGYVVREDCSSFGRAGHSANCAPSTGFSITELRDEALEIFDMLRREPG